LPVLCRALECHLRLLIAQETCNLGIRDIAKLVVVVHNLSILIADAAIASFHERIASLVARADVAVDAGPSLVAGAEWVCSYRTVRASS
jgi:hypothetical protein